MDNRENVREAVFDRRLAFHRDEQTICRAVRQQMDPHGGSGGVYL